MHAAPTTTATVDRLAYDAELGPSIATRREPLKVLLCHAYYQQRGGEDISFEQEAELLESRGLRVRRFTVRNDELAGVPRLRAASRSIWNRHAAQELRGTLARDRPEVVHFTNTFPLLSPAVLHAARRSGAAVVQALRNYRLLCANAQFLRAGQPCEACLGRLPWRALVHGCYRGSRAATAAVVAGTVLHRSLRTYSRNVDMFFTLSEFARGRFIAAGFPAERVIVKPNFVPPPTPQTQTPPAAQRRGVVFVGRLSPEKGIETLLAAWRLMPTREPLILVGDGPLAPLVHEAARGDARIQVLGPQPAQRVQQLLAEALVLAMPSIWYETFGRTIIEAFSVATPVVASRLGAMAELVGEGHSGRLFAPGDASDLARTLTSVLADRSVLRGMGEAAAETYAARYTPERNYALLLDVYQAALRQRALGNS